MAEWIITATEIYDVVSAFNKLKKLEWKQDNFHPNVGDIVYIYVTKTAELKFKCKVNETGIKKQDLKIDDREFRNYKENNEDNSTWMEIELIKRLYGPAFAKKKLLENGFHNGQENSQNTCTKLENNHTLNNYLQSIQENSSTNLNCSLSQATWISAAFLSYCMYQKGKSWPFYYFNQNEILNFGRDNLNITINNAQVSQHNNADHAQHTTNYLRGTLPGQTEKIPQRRLSRFDEFSEKTHPDNLDPNIQINGIKIQDLLNFVEKDYPEIFNTKIDYCSILKYIEEYADKEYKKPEKCNNQEEKNYFSELRKIAQERCNEFNSIPELFINSPIIPLDDIRKSAWTDGSNRYLRHYLWIRMRQKKYKDDPTSISIFAQFDQQDPKKACFRVSVENEDKDSTPQNWAHYHSHLTRSIPANSDLIYVSGSKCDRDLQIIGKDSATALQMLKDQQVQKVQICKYIRQKEGQTNEYFEYEIAQAIVDLMPYYEHVVKNGENMQRQEKIEEQVYNESNDDCQNYPKNLILYGPPGTGKTYNSVIYAVAICEETSVDTLKKERYSEILRRYREYTEEGRISFTTFHQSYGYEEFIEGIKPRLSNENSESLDYVLEDGLFKKFCLRAKDSTINSEGITIPAKSKIWGMFLGGSGNTSVKAECFQNNEIRLGFHDISDDNLDDLGVNSCKKRMITSFINLMEVGDLVLIAENTKSIDAIGVITGDYEFDESREDYARKRKVRWLIKNESHDITEILPDDRKQMPRTTIFSLDYLKRENILKLLSKSLDIEVQRDTRPRVFIIDEINRGNISKIFGELITLIEESKREGALEEMHAILPYSKVDFSVPNNVFILGTMNTADRSIALMDTALRRRFAFEEMLPDTKILDELGIGIVSFDDQIELDLSKMIETINNRIAYLYDREHTIGHAFFTKLALNYNIETLAEIFKKKIIPLLQEYFYDDYEKIQLVLGDNDTNKPLENRFIVEEELKIDSIFKGNTNIDLPKKSYRINDQAFTDINSYILIYEG